MVMTLVKLNRTHRLYHLGFVYAFRFNRKSIDALKLFEILNKSYPHVVDGKPSEYRWKSYRSKMGKPFWIGVTHEEMLTFAILSMD